MQGRSATCKGASGYGQAPCKGRPAADKAPMQRGDRLRLSSLQGAATRRGNSPAGTIGCYQVARACCPRCNHKGQPPAARAIACKAARGSPAARAAACKGGRWQERQLAGAVPA
ncbi:hypothetical protein BHM03_00043409 [Ensete ventricosum]|nr:hypothetical protein BHM03_00043409 [Ensete ventricosum]